MKENLPKWNDKEEVYIEQLEGIETFNPESHVCYVKRALYGLKQEARA